MAKLINWLLGAGVGAGAVYLLDPRRGEQRRTQLSAQVNRLRRDAVDGYEEGILDLRHRVRGLFAEGMAMMDESGAPDWLVEERVRSRLGFYSRYPKALEVSIHGGQVTLKGPVLAQDVDRLLTGISAVRGVKGIDNQLQVHESDADMPQGYEPAQRVEGYHLWSPASRLLGVFGASTLLLYSLTRSGVVRPAVTLAGVGLALRSLTNRPINQILGMGQNGDLIQVNKSMLVNAPVHEVYQLWSNYENFPRFMANIKEIQRSGDNRSHWVVAGPAGVPVAFDAITTRQVENEVIAWETVPEASVKHAGLVRFRPVDDERTQINVRMSYMPPAGVIGHGVAAVFGADPKSSMDEDMARLKSLLEHGKTAAKGQRVRKQDVMPAGGGE